VGTKETAEIRVAHVLLGLRRRVVSVFSKRSLSILTDFLLQGNYGFVQMCLNILHPHLDSGRRVFMQGAQISNCFAMAGGCNFSGLG